MPIVAPAPSIKYKLVVPKELYPKINETLQGFANACNQILVAKKPNCWNTAKLQYQVYRPNLCSYGLIANHVWQAIASVLYFNYGIPPANGLASRYSTAVAERKEASS